MQKLRKNLFILLLIIIIVNLLELFAHLVDKVQQFLLGGVHAHRSHGVSQLGGVDGPAPVHIELVEGLPEFRHLLLTHFVVTRHYSVAEYRSQGV